MSPALKRKNCRSAKEARSRFCLQLSWGAQIQDQTEFSPDMQGYSSAILKKRKSVGGCDMSRVLADPSPSAPVCAGNEVGLLWAWGRPGGLHPTCQLVCSHCLHQVNMTFGWALPKWLTQECCIPGCFKSPDMGESGLREIKNFGITQPVLDLGFKIRSVTFQNQYSWWIIHVFIL